ncbi:MAG: type II toxin-antitoxin system death-on-curing family toxin [Acidobacteriaceae bacterium]
MKRWRWIKSSVVFAIHDRQLAEHGGLDGVRDEAAIDSALSRPINLARYAPDSDSAALAACYAFSIAPTHGFADGNKRTAWVVARLFLFENRFQLSFDPSDAVRIMESVAAGKLPEIQLANWFRSRISRVRR